MTRSGIQPGYAILAGLALFVCALIVFQSMQQLPVAAQQSPAAKVASKPAAAEQYASVDRSLAGQASVVDGDTIEIHGIRIRLAGIDAPESRQVCEIGGSSYRCGQKAALALSDFISSRMVQCTPTGKDRWQRVIAKCFADGADLGSWMVTNGWAVAYRKYSLDYVADESRAQVKKVGIWAGTFTLPEQWRLEQQKGK